MHRKRDSTYNFPMMKTNTKEMGTKIAKLLILAAAVYLGMKFIFPVVLPFFAALVLARILYPLAMLLEKKTGLKRTASRSAAYVIFLFCTGALAGALLYFFCRMGMSGLNHWDSFKEGANAVFCQCCSRIEQISGIAADEIQKTISREAEGLTGGAVEYSKDAGFYLIGLLAKVFVAFIAAFLMLVDYEKITGGLQSTYIGKCAADMLHEIKAASWAYLRAQLCIMGIVTFVCIAGLFVLQIRYAFWLGLAVGICDALPFLGTGTVFVPWAVIDLLLGHYGLAAGLFVIYIVCSFIRQMLEPKLVGKSLGIPPLAVLMSIYIGIQVYGGAGVLTGPVSALVFYEVWKYLNA